MKTHQHTPPTSHPPAAITQAALAALAAVQERPCLSICQATHRSHPENQQDPIRFRQHLKALGDALRLHHAPAAAQSLLAPFDALAHDAAFWNHTLDGLVVLGAPGLFRVFQLPRPVAELAVVGDSFHTKPLRQFLQSVERYQVLCLSLGKVQLFEGDRNALDPITLAQDVPATLHDTDGALRSEPHAAVSSYGGVGRGHVAMHHGHGGKADEMDNDTARFFRAVDRAVLEHHSRPSGLPLMLAALPEHHHQFRLVSQNPYLMAAGVMHNPEGLSASALREQAWEIALPQHQARQTAWTDAYAVALSMGLGSEDVADVARAAAGGRVASLLIEADRQLPGRIDAATGRIDATALGNPRGDDLLDDLGALVEKMGGEVHVLSARRMPGNTGVAASYRH
jgi:hypothetical protein